MYSCSYVLTFLVQKAKVGEDVHENSGGAYKLTARVVSHEENNLACEKTRSVRTRNRGTRRSESNICAKYCGSYIDCVADRTYEYKAKICMAITLKSR